MQEHVSDTSIEFVSPQGEMTIYHIAELAQEFLPLLTTSAQLVVDLKDVTEIDSSGAQLLMLARRERLQAGKQLALVNHSEAVVSLFSLLGLLDWFDDPVLLAGDA
ncbi:STAS domain-containing protein [Shewanella dokdonensis]|uniref:STAS domain-containing protein n=1 Tax=Shewanella dokdonensis TaxID=712036 RepID=A0ABX8DJV3_9GAMM|nr:STAS domain-containing protein [Shewanella dokdonensis]MCL1075918.1 STAS domain-containing protein [Shewanella dokdonensis]QVK24237.1 STAS domain-containing protein [Shewanella dokdonensis]